MNWQGVRAILRWVISEQPHFRQDGFELGP